VDLLRVLSVLTAKARALGAAGIEIIKNRGAFAGGTVLHPHWQARILTRPLPRPRRQGLSVAELARAESSLGRRIFFRKRTRFGQVVGWRSYAGWESNIAILRDRPQARRRCVGPAHWLCDATEAERRVLAGAMAHVAACYEAEGIEDYNVIASQPRFVRRPRASTDVFRLVFVPRGPGYELAGFEMASGRDVLFIAGSPEDQARQMRTVHSRTTRPATQRPR